MFFSKSAKPFHRVVCCYRSVAQLGSPEQTEKQLLPSGYTSSLWLDGRSLLLTAIIKGEQGRQRAPGPLAPHTSAPGINKLGINKGVPAPMVVTGMLFILIPGRNNDDAHGDM